MYCVGVVTNVESYLQPVQEGALLGSHFVYDAPLIRLPLDEKTVYVTSTGGYLLRYVDNLGNERTPLCNCG